MRTTCLKLFFCVSNAAILCFAQPSAANISFTQSGTGVVARTVDAKLKDTVSVKDFGAMGNGSHDDTAAIQAAVDWAAGWYGRNGFMTVTFPHGQYRVTSTIAISGQQITLEGAGKAATTVVFEPRATASLFKFSVVGGGDLIFRCGLKHMMILGNNAQTKTAIELVDASEFVLEDVAVGGPYPWTGGAGSVALALHGRDHHRISDLNVWADIPVTIGLNPNGTVALDHATFFNCYFVAGSSHPVITVANGVVMQSVHFTGAQSWVGGTYGLYWDDTTSSQVSLNVDIDNVRWEQSTNASGYSIWISTNSGLVNFSTNRVFSTGTGTAINGIYLRNVNHSEISNFTYNGAQACVDIGSSTNTQITLRNVYCATGGATINTTGATLIHGDWFIAGSWPPKNYIMADVCAEPTCGTAITVHSGITNTTVNGVSPTTMRFVDATSSIQKQLDGKVPFTGAYIPNFGIPSSSTWNFQSGGGLVTQTIASNSTAMGTSSIASGACSPVVTAAATGVATTDVVTASFNGDPTAVTGYIPLSKAALTLFYYPTSGNVNFKVCNFTSSSITPGAIKVNWRVVR